jgi:hypothetical protein
MWALEIVATSRSQFLLSRIAPQNITPTLKCCTLGGFNVSNLMEIKRRMIAIDKKMTFYFLQNAPHCTVFSHFHLKFAKSAIMAPKNFVVNKLCIFKHFAKSKKLFSCNFYHSPFDSYWSPLLYTFLIQCKIQGIFQYSVAQKVRLALVIP